MQLESISEGTILAPAPPPVEASMDTLGSTPFEVSAEPASAGTIPEPREPGHEGAPTEGEYRLMVRQLRGRQAAREQNLRQLGRRNALLLLAARNFSETD